MTYTLDSLKEWIILFCQINFTATSENYMVWLFIKTTWSRYMANHCEVKYLQSNNYIHLKVIYVS